MVAAMEVEAGELLFHPPLYCQRAQLVQRTLERFRCRRVVDAGCSNGDLLRYVLNSASLSEWQPTDVTAIDLDLRALAAATRAVPCTWSSTIAYTEDAHVRFVHGDLTVTPPEPCPALPECVDAVFSIEVLEHIPPHLVAAYTYTLFASLGAARGATVVLLTTPNRDENTRLPRGAHAVAASTAADGDEDNSIYRPWEAAPPRRHDEHYFELTRRQWRRYVAYVEEHFGVYWRAAAGEEVLLGGGFTQGSLFVRRHDAAAASAWDRAAIVHAFPFFEIFGMSPAAYSAAFLGTAAAAAAVAAGVCSPTAAMPLQEAADDTNDADAAAAYTVVESRVLEGVAVWDVFCDAVRHAATRRAADEQRTDASLSRRPTISATTAPAVSASSALSFERFYSCFVVPRLPWVLERCSLMLLLRRGLAEQHQLWTDAVTRDWARWVEFVAVRGSATAPLRTCGLQVGDAALRCGALGPRAGACCHPASPVPLVCHHSRADRILSDVLRADVSASRLARWRARGRRILRRAAANSTGLLLHTWVHGQILLCVDGAAHTSGTAAAAAAAATSTTITTAATAHTLEPALAMEGLPAAVLHILFFLVSVDVLPEAWRALQRTPPVQVSVALWRDVAALLQRLPAAARAALTAESADARAEPRPHHQLFRRRRERTPAWLPYVLRQCV